MVARSFKPQHSETPGSGRSRGFGWIANNSELGIAEPLARFHADQAVQQAKPPANPTPSLVDGGVVDQYAAASRQHLHLGGTDHVARHAPSEVRIVGTDHVRYPHRVHGHD